MRRNILLSIGILFALILITGQGCQQQTKYVCPNGATVSDTSLCPKQKITQEESCEVESRYSQGGLT